VPVRIAPRFRPLKHLARTGLGLALATLFLISGSSGLQDAEAAGDIRTLSFAHTHRDDKITVTFRRNGSYDEDGLKKLNHYLRDWRTDDVTRMDPQLFDILWEVHREVGAKEPIHIISSYRSPNTNAMLRRRGRGVARFSQHTQGKAIDFFIPGVPLADLRAAGLRLQRGGVGFYPTSGSPFVHLDTGSIRHWPRMTHDQLARVFPDGKTVHVPTDGTPLKGYHMALAEVRRRGNGPSATSLESARGAGIATADAGGASGGRGLFAKLFGIGQDDEEDTTEAAPRAKPAAQAPARQLAAAAVPLPRARPGQQPGTFTLASTSAQPVQQPGTFTLASATTSAQPTPADIINSRGYWQGSPGAAASEPVRRAAPALAALRAAETGSSSAPPEAGGLPEAVGTNGARLAWITGPEGRPVPPRPPRDIEVAPAVETTSSVADWATNPGQNDRIPTDFVLAYAATATAAEPVARTAAAAPMGAVRTAPTAGTPNATIANRKPAPLPPAKPVQGNIDPWLRGVVMTPSVQHSLSVAVLGAPDYRTLRPLMHKPKTTVAMVFSNDPTLGIVAETFTGPAVTFLPTISVTTRTAGLN
jgi:uncharacterized protein YcbK (DUF882 family)